MQNSSKQWILRPLREVRKRKKKKKTEKREQSKSQPLSWCVAYTTTPKERPWRPVRRVQKRISRSQGGWVAVEVVFAAHRSVAIVIEKCRQWMKLKASSSCLSEGPWRHSFPVLLVLLPAAPDGGKEVRHVDTLGAHLDHPGVLEHAPGGCAAGGFFLETVGSLARLV